jgi:tetratricopeptide (TPR) repeat protein
VARAAILNEMGVTASCRGAFIVASDHHNAARRLLEDSARALASRAGRFELARTLMLLCSIASRNGVESLAESLHSGHSHRAGPPLPSDHRGQPGAWSGSEWPRVSVPFPRDRRGEWNEAIGRAIELVRGLLDEEPEEPEFRLFLARAYREHARIARLRSDRAVAERSLETAVGYLDRLVRDFPKHPGYHSALAEMLCTPLSLPDAGDLDAGALRRVERAVALARELIAAYPQIPEHRHLIGGVLSRLASLEHASHQPTRARATYREALAFQEPLAREMPTVLNHTLALAESLQGLAEAEVVLGLPEDAAGHLEAAIAQLERFPKGNAGRFLPPLISRLQHRRAAIAVGPVPDPDPWRVPGAARSKAVGDSAG